MDPVERKLDSLRNMFATVVGEDCRDWHADLFREWLERSFPIELCRQAIREAAREKRSELPQGVDLRAKDVRLGFLRSVLVRLQAETRAGQAVAPKRGFGRRSQPGGELDYDNAMWDGVIEAQRAAHSAAPITPTTGTDDDF